MSTSKLWGLNMKEPVWKFHELQLPIEREIRSICCGNESIALATMEGEVYTASIKNGEIQGWTRPPGLSQHDVCQVESGRSHHVALTADGKLLTWGRDSQGQLGRSRGRKKSTGRNTRHNASLIENFQGMKVIQVSCGDAHSVCLTEDGHVHTWGANDCGQLGRDDASTVPRIVKHLEHIHIVQVAAGGRHSFALSKSGAVFCWGSNSFGQLSLKPERKSQPFPVECTLLADQNIQSISCGENHTAFLTQDGHVFTCGLQGHQDGADPMDHFQGKKIQGLDTPVSQIACGRNYTLSHITTNSFHFSGTGKSETIELPEQYWKSTLLCGKDFIFVYQSSFSHDTAPFQHMTLDVLHEMLNNKRNNEMKIMLERLFSNASCINGSFQTSDSSSNGRSESHHGVDLNKAEACFKELRISSFFNIVEQALERLLKNLSGTKLFGIESLRMFLILPCCLYANLEVYNIDIVTSLANILVTLDEKFITSLGKWLKSIPTKFFKKYVWFFKMSVTKAMTKLKNDNDASETTLSKHSMTITSCVEVLDVLNEINNGRFNPIPFVKFQIKDLIDKINIPLDYIGYTQDINKPFAFCKYRFLYDSASKFVLLGCQCEKMMQQHKPTDVNIYLEIFHFYRNQLKVRRDHLIEDAKILLSKDGGVLRQDLNVIFVDENTYTGPGIKQEFFQVLFQELLDPEFGAFYYEEDSNVQWFTKNSNLENLYFIGLMCGLALYNGVTLHLQFPPALYKKLLKKPVTFRDFWYLKPVNYRSFKLILDYHEDDFEDAFDLDFMIESVELCENGTNIPVTQSNKEDYINKVTEFYLETSIEKEFKSFYIGFYTGIPTAFLSAYNFQDLEEVLCGNESYDFKAFEKATEYEWDYNTSHKTIQFFWEVFHEMELVDQKAFLRFLTGTHRIPAYGINRLQMTVSPRDGPEGIPDGLLPLAYTCTNTLSLPRYTNKDSLKEMVLYAARCFTGFGLPE